jgi:hypothetical protein
MTYFYTIINYFITNLAPTMKKKTPVTYRDLGYFYIGLIIPLPFRTNDEPPGHVAS